MYVQLLSNEHEVTADGPKPTQTEVNRKVKRSDEISPETGPRAVRLVLAFLQVEVRGQHRFTESREYLDAEQNRSHVSVLREALRSAIEGCSRVVRKESMCM